MLASLPLPTALKQPAVATVLACSARSGEVTEPPKVQNLGAFGLHLGHNTICMQQ